MDPRTYRLPVIYVFGKKPVDVKDAAEKLLESCTSHEKVAALKHDVAYTHEAGTSCDPDAPCDIYLPVPAERLVLSLRDVFSKHGVTVSYTPIPRKLGPSTAAAATPMEHDGPLSGDRDSQDTTPILYIGSPSLALTNLLMTHSSTPVRTRLRAP